MGDYNHRIASLIYSMQSLQLFLFRYDDMFTLASTNTTPSVPHRPLMRSFRVVSKPANNKIENKIMPSACIIGRGIESRHLCLFITDVTATAMETIGYMVRERENNRRNISD